MNIMTTIKGLTRRGGLAAFALAMLSLTAISTPVQAQAVPRYECKFCEKALSTIHASAEAQEIRSFDAFGGFQGGVSVGAAARQTVRIVFRTTNDIDPSLDPSTEPDVIVTAGPSLGGRVKAFNASTGALLWSRELTSLTPGLHTIDINRDDLPEVGNTDTGRIQLWIEVVIVGQDGMNVFPPTFEVFENESGRTTLRGGLWKTTNFLTTDPLRSRPIVFTGLE